MSKIKQYISFLFLSIFIFIKIAGLHGLSHLDQDTHNDCEICQYVTSANTHHFLINASTHTGVFITTNYTQETLHEYTYSYYNNNISYALFGRPPPTV